MSLKITGRLAEVRWGYRPAATVGQWTITDDRGGLTVTAMVIESDADRLQQQPMTFVVPREQGAWSWPVTSLLVVGETLTASLGPQE